MNKLRVGEKILKIDERHLTPNEFEEVIRAFYLRGYERGIPNPMLSIEQLDQHFQKVLFEYGLKTHP